MGTGVTLSTEPPENFKEQRAPKEGFENRIVTVFSHNLQCKHCKFVMLLASKFYGQALGLISSGQLSAFQRLHTHPINVVVYHEPHWQN